MKHQHPFHLVKQSPWPMTASFGALTMTSGLAMWFNNGTMKMFMLGIMATTLTSIKWWRDIMRESTFQGHHTLMVIKGLRYGMMLFITSEVCFFFAFFWAFFHSSLAPSMEMGVTWPPTGMNPMKPFLVPLLKTAVLLSSGMSMTWCHHSMMKSKRKESMQALSMTVMLGMYFTALQLWEYKDAPFSMADSMYGSTFFVATGFHGLHVIMGTTFLSVCLWRLMKNHFSKKHHFGFEAATWYWHFVDVVWLFLYMCMYWWGS